MFIVSHILATRKEARGSQPLCEISAANHGCLGKPVTMLWIQTPPSSFFYFNGLVLFSYLLNSQIWCFGSSLFSFVTMLSHSQTLNLRDHHRRSRLFRCPPRFSKPVHARNFISSSVTRCYSDSDYGVQVSFAFDHFQRVVICFVLAQSMFAFWRIYFRGELDGFDELLEAEGGGGGGYEELKCNQVEQNREMLPKPSCEY